jgi:prevent-host-death family protein
MAVHTPSTQTIATSAVSQVFLKLVEQVSQRETRVLLEEDGKPVAAIVSAEDLRRLTQLDAQWEDDWKIFDEIHARNLDKTPEEVEHDVAEAIAAVRARTHRQRRRQSST